MKNINAHFYPSCMTNESRIFKESDFISKNIDFDKIFLLGVWKNGLETEENLDKNIYIKRISLLKIEHRAISYLYFFFYSLIFIVWNKPRMINIHTLEFLPLAMFAKVLKIKVIYDAHEFETEKANFKGFRKKVSKILERTFIKFVDEVVVVSESIANEYKKMYPSMDKPFVVLNTPFFQEVSTTNNKFREKFCIDEDQVVFLYQGGLGYDRGIEYILDVFENLDKKLKSVIVFMGFGPLAKLVKEKSKVNDNIYYLDAVKPDELLSYTSSADFGVLFYENTCLNHYYCSPNKFFEYIMAGVPVIVSNLYELKRIVDNENVGVVANDISAQGLNEAVNQAVLLDKTVLRNNVDKTKMIYNWQEQEKQLYALYKKINLILVG